MINRYMKKIFKSLLGGASVSGLITLIIYGLVSLYKASGPYWLIFVVFGLTIAVQLLADSD